MNQSIQFKGHLSNLLKKQSSIYPIVASKSKRFTSNCNTDIYIAIFISITRLVVGAWMYNEI